MSERSGICSCIMYTLRFLLSVTNNNIMTLMFSSSNAIVILSDIGWRYEIRWTLDKTVRTAVT